MFLIALLKLFHAREGQLSINKYHIFLKNKKSLLKSNYTELCILPQLGSYLFYDHFNQIKLQIEQIIKLNWYT